MLTATSTQPLLPLSTEDKPSLVLSVLRTQVIEHITKLITINEAAGHQRDRQREAQEELTVARSSMESPKS